MDAPFVPNDLMANKYYSALHRIDINLIDVLCTCIY